MSTTFRGGPADVLSALFKRGGHRLGRHTVNTEDVYGRVVDRIYAVFLSDMDRETVCTRAQERAENVREYFSVMQKLAKKSPGVDEI